MQSINLEVGMGVTLEPEKSAPFMMGMGTKNWKKMGMG